MGQLEALVWTQGPQGLDNAKAHPAAAVDGDARGLVNHEQPVIFMDDGFADGLLQVGGGAANLLRRPDPHGRNPDLVVSLQPGVGARAVAVYADFTFADNPVNLAPGHLPQSLVYKEIGRAHV